MIEPIKYETLSWRTETQDIVENVKTCMEKLNEVFNYLNKQECKSAPNERICEETPIDWILDIKSEIADIRWNLSCIKDISSNEDIKNKVTDAVIKLINVKELANNLLNVHKR